MAGPHRETGCWALLEHDADIGLRAEAASREALFELMGEALTAVVTSPAAVQTQAQVTIRCQAPDDAMLMVDWLNALIYAMATRRMLFGAWHVVLDGGALNARVGGEVVDRRRHRPAVEIKGATYTDLAVGRTPGGLWRARCVVDV